MVNNSYQKLMLLNDINSYVMEVDHPTTSSTSKNVDKIDIIIQYNRRLSVINCSSGW